MSSAKILFNQLTEDSQTVLKEYICPLCQAILHEPVMDICGDIFCRECIESFLKEKQECPLNAIYIAKDEFAYVGFMQDIIEKQMIYCRFKQSGCQWKGKICEFDDHLEKECLYQSVLCPNEGCLLDFVKGAINSHLDECAFRKEKCAKCDEDVLVVEMVEHEQERCLRRGVKCSEGCGLLIQYDELDKHLKTECENGQVECCLRQLGCDQLFLRKYAKRHFEEFYSFHVKLLIDELKMLRKTYEELSKESSENKNISNEKKVVEKKKYFKINLPEKGFPIQKELPKITDDELILIDDN